MFLSIQGFFVPFIYITARAKTEDSMQQMEIYLIPVIGTRIYCKIIYIKHLVIRFTIISQYFVTSISAQKFRVRKKCLYKTFKKWS